MGRSVRALVVRVIVVFDEFRNFRILDLTFLYRVDAGESAQLFLYQFAENGTPYTFQNGDNLTLSLTLQDGTQATVTVTV